MSVIKKLYTNLFYYKFWPVARQIFKQKNIPTDLKGFDELQSQQIVQNFMRTYDQNGQLLKKSLVLVYWKRFIVTVVLRILLTGLYYLYPLYFYPYFLNYTGGDETHLQGILMVVQFSAASLGITYCQNKNLELQNLISLEIKTIITHLINSKILRDICDRPNTKKFNNSMITTDLLAITSFLTDFNYTWAFLLTLTITLYYLYCINEIVAIFALVLLILEQSMIEYLISRSVQEYDREYKKVQRKRLLILKEVSNGIKIVKLYDLNKEKELEKLRLEEVKKLKKLQIFETISYVIQTVAPLILSLVMLFIFMMSSQPLTIEKIFVTLSYLETMNFPTKMCSKLWIGRKKLKNSWEHIVNFLNDPITEYTSPQNNQMSESNVAIQIEKVSFECGPHEYKDISFDVPKGSRNVIIGDIGAGKSTFLSALLKLVDIGGNVNIDGTVSYVPAEPFLFQATVEENIVFGYKNDQLYGELLEKLCLKPDLRELQKGDETDVNERGVNLSGGQKQRICLARSVYQNADIYLLDDPLTSVDIQVTKQILNNLLNRVDGILKDKTLLYVANNFTVLNHSDIDNIILLEEERIVIMPFKEFQKTNQYSELTRPITQTIRREAKVIGPANNNLTESEPKSDTRIIQDTDGLLSNDRNNNEDHRLPIKKLYALFAEQFGRYPIFIVILLAIVGLLCSIESYRSLSELATSLDKNETFLKYGVLKLLEISTMTVNWIVIFYCCLNLSNRLITKGVVALFKLPIQYFHKMTSGGVSYLFSSDFAAIDTTLPKAYRDLIEKIFTMLSSIVSLWYLSKWNYWTGIGVGTSFVLIGLYIALIRFNMQISFRLKTSERQRNLMISKYFGDAETGAIIIQTNGMVDSFKQRLYKRLDNYLRQALMAQIGHRWFTCHLEFVGISIVFTTMSALVMLNSSSAAFGIALICTGKIISNLNQLNMSITNVNDQMVSFNKIDEFLNKSYEGDNGTETIDTTNNDRMTVTFNAVNFRYDDRLVLHNISFELESCDRIGIIGRTGTGKSTIISSLLRLFEIYSGQIQICGKNIQTIKLKCLRNLITLIPQECDIFDGSLAENLDPSNLYLPNEIHKMLERLNLMGLKGRLNMKWESKIISDGEKQLLCLIRGLLRNTKIMVFDETCSKVDLKTERLIQDLLNSEQYYDSIMMVVAHRPQSLDICNKIMVLDDGHIIEYGFKEELMQNIHSHFYKFMHQFRTFSTRTRDEDSQQHESGIEDSNASNYSYMGKRNSKAAVALSSAESLTNSLNEFINMKKKMSSTSRDSVHYQQKHEVILNNLDRMLQKLPDDVVEELNFKFQEQTLEQIRKLNGHLK